ncbi:MAG: hypothetical protein Tsb0032_32270 [Kiloniellaceae bacterium]
MIFEDLKARGEAALHELIASSHQEGFGLEFKRKENSETWKLSKQDKRNLGAALSAFSNADGGLVIFGIETKKEDGADVAAKAVPISEISRFKGSVDALIGEYLRPENSNIETFSISSADKQGAGFLAILIGKSEARPHMSMAPDHQKYFRRGVDATRVMDHSEIRDMLLAPREAELGVSWSVDGYSSTERGVYDVLTVSVQLYLENVGTVAAIAPFMRCFSQASWLKFEGAHEIDTRTHRNGSVGVYSSRNNLLHASDELHVGQIRLSGGVFVDALRHKFSKSGSDALAFPDIWAFGDESVFRDLLTVNAEFEPVELSLVTGAENAPTRAHHFVWSKKNFIRLVIEGAEERILSLAQYGRS